MDMRKKTLLVCWIALASLAAGQTARRVDDAALKNAGKTGEEWLTYGHTPGETRYSTLRQIDTSNVSRLGLAWSHEIGAGGGGQEATPLVWNGTIYGITNWSIVFAMDARTGQGALALGSGGEPDCGASQGLLRRGESRAGDLSGHDHRAGDRRPTAGVERGNREGDLGSARGVSAGRTTPSPWLRGSPKGK